MSQRHTGTVTLHTLPFVGFRSRFPAAFPWDLLQLIFPPGG